MKEMSIRDAYELISMRDLASNKSDYGRLLEICGSKGMAGAAILCGKAALRSGVGILDIVVQDDIYPIVAGNVHEAVYTIYEDKSDVLASLRKATAIVMGCGLNPNDTALILDILVNSQVPMVLDAEALNVVSHDLSFLMGDHAPVIITPHAKEMSRLTGVEVEFINENREEIALRFAQQFNVIVVLKGYHTLVVSPKGQIYQNTTGNPGMATGGSGDVLSGIIGSFIAQHKDPYTAACSGVYFHGLAGDIAAERTSMTSLLPTDIINVLPEIFRRIEEKK